MITIFNRKEIARTFSMKEQSELRNKLEDAGVDYYAKTVNRSSPSAFSSGTRGRSGTFGQKQEMMYEYIFYVHKSDFEKSQFGLR